MIKGIYNENEFYTNFYWDNKFLEDLRSKLGGETFAEAAIGALKGLDTQFWTLKELPEGDPKHIEALVEFYKNLFRTLGYASAPTSRQTASGQFLSLFGDVRRSGVPDLFAVLVSKSEPGAFESPPLFIGSEAQPVDFELSEIIREEFQDSQNPPRWILVGAPNAFFVIERNKWSFGRYLRIEWQEVFLQRDAKPYEVLLGLASKKVLCPDAGSSPHDEFDENSHRHAFEVTTELRESVREAIELLINEMIDLKKESHQKIYSNDSADQYAKELTHDALYYVYRLLFLLYLEAQGDDSELLPLKSEIYRNGYSLEKLLELDYVDVAPDSAESKGTFLFESLDQIFNLIFFGFEPEKEGIFKSEAGISGFLVKGIKSDLFDPAVIRHLKGVKIRNGVLLDILKKLSLTRKKERGGKPRARVSYANLGINQLGAVYEGLLSYSGFFAQEDLHALKSANVKQSDLDRGIDLDQIFLAPKSLVERYRKSSEKKYKLSAENTVLDDSGNPKIYKKGSFIYRMAGRDRQKLASYYTPESLTKCTVKYSLKVLVESQNTLEKLWSIKILEPAMGSGAFLNEAVNQVADAILALEVQQNGGDLKSPKAKQKRLWEIKYQLISKNIYGVDLNPIAVELARFSLWLNCIGAGKEPPSFEGRLKIGNSLIGARFKKGADGLFPWLLLDERMMDYGNRLKDYSAKQFETIRDFRKEFYSSRLESTNQKLKVIQSKAEQLLKAVGSSLEESNSKFAYAALKACADIWCSSFFLNEDDIKVFPSSHSDLLSIFETILEAGPSAIPGKMGHVISDKVRQERFFHWELEFPEAIGGFDLVVGNPPWVTITFPEADIVSDFDSLPSLSGLNSSETREFVGAHPEKDAIREILAEQYIRSQGEQAILDLQPFECLNGLNRNTYKFFIILSLSLLSEGGACGLIHEDSILEDTKGEAARSHILRKQVFHFQFNNENYLFSEIGNKRRYAINIYRGKAAGVHLVHIGSLFLPATVDECFQRSEEGFVPSLKDENGNWNIQGHRSRIIEIGDRELRTFGRIFKSDSPFPPVLNLFSIDLFETIDLLANASSTIREYLADGSYMTSNMLHETGAQDADIIIKKPGRPKTIENLVFSGPNIELFSCFSQQAKDPYKNHRSYEKIDPQSIDDDFLPRTVYQTVSGGEKVDTYLANSKLNGVPFRKLYRVSTRKMVDVTIERSLFTCIVPPGPSHIDSISSIACENSYKLVLAAGVLSSILADFVQRTKTLASLFPDDMLDFPFFERVDFRDAIVIRTLALNCLSRHFARLFEGVKVERENDTLMSGKKLLNPGQKWSQAAALRTQGDRLTAAVELDALVALSFGLEFRHLKQIYDIYFPVLKKYDQEAGINRNSLFEKAFGFFEKRGW